MNNLLNPHSLAVSALALVPSGKSVDFKTRLEILRRGDRALARFNLTEAGRDESEAEVLLVVVALERSLRPALTFVETIDLAREVLILRADSSLDELLSDVSERAV